MQVQALLAYLGCALCTALQVAQAHHALSCGAQLALVRAVAMRIMHLLSTVLSGQQSCRGGKRARLCARSSAQTAGLLPPTSASPSRCGGRTSPGTASCTCCPPSASRCAPCRWHAAHSSLAVPLHTAWASAALGDHTDRAAVRELVGGPDAGHWACCRAQADADASLRAAQGACCPVSLYSMGMLQLDACAPGLAACRAQPSYPNQRLWTMLGGP